jgi:hypothetical protein
VEQGRRGEPEPILQSMAEHQLYSALPQGTITYSHVGLRNESTIDLMLIPSQLRPLMISCQVYEVDHGSDHKATSLKLNYQRRPWKTPPQRRSYNMADWDSIRQTLQVQLGPAPVVTNTDDLDKATQGLESQIQNLLQEMIPPPKAFPYAKRWWSKELTQLRKEYNYRRNQWTAESR